MTKAEKIKEAWIAEIGEERYNNCEKHINFEKGFLTAQYLCYHKDWRGLKFEHDSFAGSNDTYIRPKSLQGIEDNNGWNRIDEVGLPSEPGVYIAYANGKQHECVYDSVDNELLHARRLKIIEGTTHWRKKEQLPNPIY